MGEIKQARIAVQVQPNASQNKVLRFQDGVLQVRIAAAPVKGKANRELINFLSDILGISKSNLTIEQGLTSRKKVISINGLTQSQALAQLEKLVSGNEDKPFKGKSG